MKELAFLAVMAFALVVISGCNKQAGTSEEVSNVTRFHKHGNVVGKKEGK